jgi:hypothetical protein
MYRLQIETLRGASRCLKAFKFEVWRKHQIPVDMAPLLLHTSSGERLGIQNRPSCSLDQRCPTGGPRAASGPRQVPGLFSKILTSQL